MTEPRTLTVLCGSGLGNRLKVLLSALAIADASRRTVTMLWPRTRACGAAYRDLFVSDWPVTDVEQLDPRLQAAPLRPHAGAEFPDLLTDPRPDIVVQHPSWLIRPGRFPGHEALRARCEALTDQLQPTPAISGRLAAFRERFFSPAMIGVHVRRGDYVRHRPDMTGNTAGVLATVDRFLGELPTAGILLCTDDGAPHQHFGPSRLEGVRGIFRRRYGNRVIETMPRSLNRWEPEAIQDALMDLFLLRATDAFVGTQGSSFSELATFGRAIPGARIAGGTPGYRRLAMLARLTGASWLIRGLARRIRGDDVPLAVACHLLRVAVARRLARAGRR